MNDFIRCNKLTGVYWLQGPVDKLKITIRLKPPDDIISLPKFEDYANDTAHVSLEQNVEEYSINWQERLFSEQEVKRYQDIHSCRTESELQYHEMIKARQIVAQKVFTYIHEDFYLPLPQQKKQSVGLVSALLERLSMLHVLNRIGDAVFGRSVSEKQLFRSQETVCEDGDHWTAMHVMFDNSDYNEDNLLVQREAVLVSLYHNNSTNSLVVSPDRNDLETNPYSVETASGEQLSHQYEVQLDFGQPQPSPELQTLLGSLHGRWERRLARGAAAGGPGGDATRGPGGDARAHYCLTLELAELGGFHEHTLYVEYHIQPAAGLRCSQGLQGRSASCSPAAGVCRLGHTLHLTLEGAAPAREPPSVSVFVEVISVEALGVRVTRGAARASVRLTAGAERRTLRCLLPSERGGDQRAYYLGGCRLTDAAHTHHQNGDYTLTEAGWVELCASVVVQRSGGAARGLGGEVSGSGGEVSGHGGAEALLRGAEAVLRRYRSARARLRQAAADTHPLE